MNIRCIRWLSDNSFESGRLYERSFSFVPLGQNLVGWSTTENTRMNQTSKTDVRNMPRGTEDAFEIPDRLGSNATWVRLRMYIKDLTLRFGVDLV